MSSSEEVCVEKIKSKDLKAFEKFIDGYSKRLYNIVYRFTYNYDDTNDIMQEIWIKFYKNIGKFKAQSSLYTYLYRIAVNHCITWKQKKQKLDKLKQYVPFIVSKQNLLDETIKNETMRVLKNGIDQLPDKQRSVFILRQEENLSFKQISEILDINENTAKVNYHYALKQLKNFLKEEELL